MHTRSKKGINPDRSALAAIVHTEESYARRRLCPDLMDAAHPRARRTAEHLVVRLVTVADDPATAALAMRRQRVDRALEAVEDMTATISRHFHDLVVLVLAHLTARHIVLPGGRRPAAPPAVEGARWLPVTG